MAICLQRLHQYLRSLSTGKQIARNLEMGVDAVDRLPVKRLVKLKERVSTTAIRCRHPSRNVVARMGLTPLQQDERPGSHERIFSFAWCLIELVSVLLLLVRGPVESQ